MEIEEKSAGNVEILSLNDRLDAIVDSKKMNDELDLRKCGAQPSSAALGNVR